MSEKLTESSFITINTQRWADNRTNPANRDTTDTAGAAEGATRASTPEETQVTSEKMPDKGNYSALGEWLEKKLAAINNSKSTDKIINNFFKKFFTTNWPTVGEKLLKIDTLRRVFIRNNKVYLPAFNVDQSPILSFITKTYVIDDLIKTDKLNAKTFKAILNAYIDKVVSFKEFTRDKLDKDYNIIYSKALYSKSPSEIYKYLAFQSKILSSTLPDEEIHGQNKLTFMSTGVATEFDPVARAEEIKQLIKNKEWEAASPVEDGDLNNLDLVELIRGESYTKTSSLDSKAQDAVVKKLKTTPAEIAAAIVLLATTTDSTKAKEAITTANSFIKDNIEPKNLFIKMSEIAKKGILPKGELNKSDADSLVTKLLAELNIH